MSSKDRPILVASKMTISSDFLKGLQDVSALIEWYLKCLSEKIIHQSLH